MPRVRLLEVAAMRGSVSDLDVRVAEVEGVIESPGLHGSESLCRLMRYLANRAIQDPDSAIREHEIAAEVFGRTESFDPRIDSTVRVNIARLRAKLIEYYNGPGAEDRITIELPRGSYRLTFQPGRVEEEPKIAVRSVPAMPAPPVGA